MPSVTISRTEFQEKCITLTVDTIHLCRAIHADATLWPLSDQVIRSVGSIGANVIEGQGAGSRKDFTNFIRIAYKSAQESQYWFTVLLRVEPRHSKVIENLLSRTQETARVLAASLKTLAKENRDAI